MKCVVFAVPFSPNLGDGVIFDCLRHGLRLEGFTEVMPVDISGRNSFGGFNVGRDMRARRLIASLPRFIRPLLPLVKFGVVEGAQLRRNYAAAASNADFAILGGGQLFSDVALNFPTKIWLLSRVLKAQKCPTAIYAVGVPPSMTGSAQFMFRSALACIPLVGIWVRDEDSATAIARIKPANIRQVGVVRDPAILSSETYAVPVRPTSEGRKVIGINVIGPVALMLGRAGGSGHEVNDAEAYVAMGRDLVAKGYAVSYMTNGSHDDDDYLAAIRAAGPELFESPHASIARKPGNPTELVSLVASYSGMIAHRLHTSIIAYSFGIPTVGFLRDPKVPAFFNSVGRGRYCVANTSSPEEVTARLVEALEEGVDEASRLAVIASVKRDFAALAAEARSSING